MAQDKHLARTLHSAFGLKAGGKLICVNVPTNSTSDWIQAQSAGLREGMIFTITGIFPKGEHDPFDRVTVKEAVTHLDEPSPKLRVAHFMQPATIGEITSAFFGRRLENI